MPSTTCRVMSTRTTATLEGSVNCTDTRTSEEEDNLNESESRSGRNELSFNTRLAELEALAGEEVP